VTGGLRSSNHGAPGPEIPASVTGGQRAWLETLDPISRKIHLQRIGLTEYGRQVKGGG
jgi:hypothetical protein